MKDQSPHSAVIETPAEQPELRPVTRELAGIVNGLLARSQNPLDDEIVELAKVIQDASEKMEILVGEMRSIGILAARLVEERGGAPEMPSPCDPIATKLPSGRISIREREVITHLLGGKSNREISRELGISEKTVKNHLWKAYRKIGVRNRTQLFHQLITT
ncbi:MAG: LuxR C-terminal-related transcriptional regulator [Candidatus Krumholzibacteriaceae bacterium]|jgi:DNA-binding NarL/FixJ family response regulator